MNLICFLSWLISFPHVLFSEIPDKFIHENLKYAELPQYMHRIYVMRIFFTYYVKVAEYAVKDHNFVDWIAPEEKPKGAAAAGSMAFIMDGCDFLFPNLLNHELALGMPNCAVMGLDQQAMVQAARRCSLPSNFDGLVRILDNSWMKADFTDDVRSVLKGLAAEVVEDVKKMPKRSKTNAALHFFLQRCAYVYAVYEVAGGSSRLGGKKEDVDTIFCMLLNVAGRQEDAKKYRKVVARSRRKGQHRVVTK